MTIDGLNTCPCGKPAAVVEDADPSINAVYIKCSADCEGKYLTDWHTNPDNAKSAWNSQLWGL